MKSWSKLTAEAGRISKGKTPSWFIYLENKLVKNKNTREVYSYYELSRDVFINKVKSHSNDKGKDMADALSKTGSLENNDNSEIFININDEVTWEYLAYWRRILIKEKEFRSDISWNNDEYVAFNIKNYLEILSMDTYLDL
ncbi:unnamed protein product [Rhizophagus irregularis]|nr:unnamed protein product [Rhizophagus irregularis]